MFGGKKNKVCLSCSESYETGFNFKKFFIAFIPLTVLSIFLQIAGLNSIMANSVVLALMIYIAIDVKGKALESNNFSAEKGCLYFIFTVLFLVIALFAGVALLSAFLG